MPPVFGFDEDRASSSPLSPWGEQFEFTRVDVVSVVIERQGVESNHVVVWGDDSLDRAVDSHVGNAVEAAHRGPPGDVHLGDVRNIRPHLGGKRRGQQDRQK
jgi:hypothetical protein